MHAMIRIAAVILSLLLGAGWALAQDQNSGPQQPPANSSNGNSGGGGSGSILDTIKNLPDTLNNVLGSPNSQTTQQQVSNTAATASQTKDKLQEIVAALKGTCWSCDAYKKIYQGTTSLVGEAFNYLTRTPEIVGVAALILMIALAVKVLKIIGTPFAPNMAGEWNRVFGFLGRIVIVFVFFLGTGAVEAMRGSAGITNNNPIRFLLIDTPTSLGTEIGCQFIKIASSKGMGSSTAASDCDAYSQSEWNVSTNENSMKTKHVEQAVAILKGIYEMCVDVIGIGVWLVTEAPTKVGSGGAIAMAAVIVAGICLVVMFMWFLISFGFRYIDALVRTTIMAAFLPIFLYMWIFESQKNMAIQALKTLAYVGAVFAASGIVFVMADQIMCAGISKALGGSCKNVSAVVSGGGFNQLVGNDGVGWVAVFILIGTGGLVIQIAGTVFALANIIIQTEVSTSAGQEAAGMMKDGVTKLVPGMR